MKSIFRLSMVCIVVMLFATTTRSQLLTGTARMHYILKPSDFSKESHFKLLFDGKPTKLCGDAIGMVTVTGGRIVLDIWSMPPGTGCPEGEGVGRSTPIKDKVLLEIVDGRLTYGDTTWVLKLPVRAWGFGVNSIPFRFRPKVSDPNVQPNAVITTAFAFATTFGYTWGHGSITTRGITNWTTSVNAFFGPSSTGSTTGVNTAATTALGPVQNNFALSYGGAAVFARNSIGIILAVGWDKAISKNAALWPYQDRLWIGLGISTTILK